MQIFGESAVCFVWAAQLLLDPPPGRPRLQPGGRGSVMQNLWSTRSSFTRTYAFCPRPLSQHIITRLLSSSAHAPPQRVGRWRWSAILLFIPGLSAFGLGSWQIMRHQWKVELLEHRRNRLRDDVVPLDLAITSVQVDFKKNNDLDAMQKDVLQSLEHKRVQCKGIFIEDKSIFLGPRGRSHHGVTERGYFLITPLVPVEGDNSNVQVPVLVNRGWVPGSWRDLPPQHAVESNHDGTVSIEKEKAKKGAFISLWGKKQETLKIQKPKLKPLKVVGVIRGSENPNMFVPPNEPAKGQWFFVDVPGMAQAVGLPENTIYVEALQDKTAGFKEKQYPDPKDPEAFISSSVMPYDHLSYAFTWFTLSAATTFMAWRRLSK